MNTTELFDPKEMTAALLETLPVRRFLTATFFNEEVHGTRSFQIDIYKGSRRLAPIVHPKLQGKVVDREKFRTFEYTPPYLKPKKVTTAGDLLTRQEGEALYMAQGSNSPAQRAANLLGKDMAELDEMILRRIEAMAAEGLFTGQVTVKGDGVDTIVSYDMESSHLPTLTGGDLWTATTTANPLEDLRAWKKLIAKDSGLGATDVVMGSAAAEAFLKNETLLKMLNTWNMAVGSVNVQEMGGGVTYYGRLTAVGLDLWSYDEWYYDEGTDTEKPMVPEDKILVIARGLRATVHYGVIQDVSAGNFASRVFVKSWEEEDPSARFLLVQSAPLPVVHQVNGYVAAKVV